MESGGWVAFNLGHLVEFRHELRDELRAAVADDLLREAVMYEDVVAEDPGGAFG